MADLARHLKRRIADEGPLGVGEFMADALTHPEHGYYMRRDPFGAGGDFITAPEISQMFGELIGLWCAVQWQALGSPEQINLVELGPGRGTLLADALRAAQGAPGFVGALDVALVEISPALRARQRETVRADGIAQKARSLAWLDAVDDVGPGPILVIANEFLDALPVRQFVLTDDGWRERLIDIAADGNGFRFIAAGNPPEPGIMPAMAEAPDPGAVFETRPAADALIRQIAGRLKRDGGAALFIDYGHERSAAGDTLQAVRGHEYADLLAAPGDADITAHVDFQAISRAARDSGVGVFGPVDQGDFLVELGLADRAEALSAAAPDRGREISAAFDRLARGDQMGRLFKVLALTGPGVPVPPGFR